MYIELYAGPYSSDESISFIAWHPVTLIKRLPF